MVSLVGTAWLALFSNTVGLCCGASSAGLLLRLVASMALCDFCSSDVIRTFGLLPVGQEPSRVVMVGIMSSCPAVNCSRSFSC